MELSVAHFLICRGIWYNHAKPEEGFSLLKVLAHIAPIEEEEYPLRIERLFAYVQYWAEPGEYRFRVRFVRLDTRGYDDIEEVPLGIGGRHRDFEWRSRRPAEFTGLNYVEELTLPVGPLPWSIPGLYEFQLFVDGNEEPIARERILARE